MGTHVRHDSDGTSTSSPRGDNLQQQQQPSQQQGQQIQQPQRDLLRVSSSSLSYSYTPPGPTSPRRIGMNIMDDYEPENDSQNNGDGNRNSNNNSYNNRTSPNENNKKHDKNGENVVI